VEGPHIQQEDSNDKRQPLAIANFGIIAGHRKNISKIELAWHRNTYVQRIRLQHIEKILLSDTLTISEEIMMRERSKTRQYSDPKEFSE